MAATAWGEGGAAVWRGKVQVSGGWWGGGVGGAGIQAQRKVVWCSLKGTLMVVMGIGVGFVCVFVCVW